LTRGAAGAAVGFRIARGTAVPAVAGGAAIAAVRSIAIGGPSASAFAAETAEAAIA
jgi:hypothetical protein